MDNNLDVKRAFDGLNRIVMKIDVNKVKPAEAADIIGTLKKIDEVLKVIF